MNLNALECTGVNRLELRNFEKPIPTIDSVLLKVKYCGICGTDTHGIEGKRAMNFPFIPGHEVVAVVDSMGERANDFIKILGADCFKPGDRVTLNPRIVCGRCYYCNTFPEQQELCLNAKTATSLGSSKYPHIFGGWSQYIYVLPGSELIKLPDGLTDENASLVEPFACGIGLADRYRGMTNDFPGNAFGRKDKVMVMGAGAIGILVIVALKLAGVGSVIAMDMSVDRLKLAKEFGAEYTIDAKTTTADDRKEMIMDITGGLGLDAVVECCGVPDTIGEGITLVKRKGILFEIGHLLNAGLAVVNPYTICRNEIQLLGHYAYPSSLTMLKAAETIEKNDYPYKKLLKFFSYTDYENVILKKQTEGAIKPVFEF